MDDTLERVQKYCSLQLHLYGQCIDSNPTDWNIKCVNERKELTKCAEDNNPKLLQVKKHCNQFIQMYKFCVDHHNNEKCQDQLDKVLQCHEQYSIMNSQ
ncbi:hypothetical protein HK103_005838 [Boothiomyces macroporosus]|uniref:IMS import disulfide relay-system CHCH-CHCH-like Cx9C domain-containing protein n=1 Tax=Boothiomyces macroporosus TaxID=261099 RepID=A0AAD5UIP7_9FUNG|nr:hypothetical protein HK103_005838 [Boothiomyces macroporosus]